jgi:hypothetical protein
VVEIIEKGKKAQYKLTSTVMLWLQTTKKDSGRMDLGGSLTRQVTGSAGRGGRGAPGVRGERG